MQGVRQGEPQLGEVALVIGLGLIGQLVVQLLTAAGVRVVGADPDPTRCELAERLGAAACGDPASAAVEAAVGLTPGIESPTVSALHREGWSAVRSMVPREGAQRLMDQLYDIGARAILLTDIHACRL